MSVMKNLFISMQEAYKVGADIEQETTKRLIARSRQISLDKVKQKSNDNDEKRN